MQVASRSVSLDTECQCDDLQRIVGLGAASWLGSTSIVFANVVESERWCEKETTLLDIGSGHRCSHTLDLAITSKQKCKILENGRGRGAQAPSNHRIQRLACPKRTLRSTVIESFNAERRECLYHSSQS